MTDSDDVDEIFKFLPEPTLRRIDKAFDRAIFESRSEDQRPRKRRRIGQDAEPELAGGFLIDGSAGNDIETEESGGFVADDHDKQEDVSSSQPTHIALSLIPRALQLLDFDPSDTQTLSVFENAASSWPTDRRKPKPSSRLSDSDMEESAPEQFVSRRDWRAVCAALIPTEGAPSSPGDSDPDSHSLVNVESDSGSSAIRSADLEESGSSEDEYVPETKRSSRARTIRGGKNAPSKPKSKSTKSRRKAKPSTSDLSSGEDEVKPLTARQKEDTLAAFALFFPSNAKGTHTDLTEEELSKKKLTIRDIASAASSIKEKITAEEIIEMLSYFSSSSTQNNPSMSFQEFQEMMITAKLA